MFTKNEINKIKEYKNKKYELINENCNDSPIFLSKKLKKYSKIDHNSEESTINTLNNENNQSIKEEKSINNNPEIISQNMNNAFNALEQLILDDCSNEANNGESFLNETSSDQKSYIEDKANISALINSNNNIKKKSMPIPKLDFSEIFEYYNNDPIFIKKVEIKKKSEHEYKIHKKKHHHRKNTQDKKINNN